MQIYNDLAVVDDLQFIQTRQTYPHEANTLRGVLEAAETHGFGHVWITPGSELSRACSDPGNDLTGWSSAASYCDPKARDKYNYVSARRVEKRHEDRIQVGMSEWHYWPWTVDRPRTLLGTVTYLQNNLGVPIEWSPAHVGLDFIRLKQGHNWSWFQPCKIDLEDCYEAFQYGNTCKEFHWHHRGELPPGKYILKRDKNSAHPAACTGINLGEGDPEFIQPAMVAGFYDGRRPGFWRVDYSRGQSLFDGVRAPAITGQYMTTDTIEELRKRDYRIQICSGWAWEHYHQALRKPMTDLYKMRMAAKQDRDKSQAHENAYKSYNAILHAIPGRLGDRDGRDPHFHRRDWWAQIVARSISTGIYDMAEIHRTMGLLPVVVDADASWWVVDHPDPVKALPGFIDRQKFGGYKDVYTLKLTSEMRDWFRDPTLSAKRVAKRLNEAHEEKVKQTVWC